MYSKITYNYNPHLTDDGIMNNYMINVVIDDKNFLCSYAETLEDAIHEVMSFLKDQFTLWQEIALVSFDKYTNPECHSDWDQAGKDYHEAIAKLKELENIENILP